MLLNRTLAFACAAFATMAVLSSCGGSSATSNDPSDHPDLYGKGLGNEKGAAVVYSDPTVDFTWDLIAGQNQLVGSVHVYNDATTLYVAYDCVNGQTMTEAHVYVGTNQPDSKGAPGQFPYNKSFSPAVSSYTFQIPLSGFNVKSKIYVATHAAMSSGETAWGGRWNNGSPSYQYKWAKKWGGYFSTNIMPVWPVQQDKTYIPAYPGANSYWAINFTNQSWYPFPGSNTWSGWCVDRDHYLTPGALTNVDIYSCYDPNLPAFAQSGNWDLISYLITRRHQATGIFNVNWNDFGNISAFQDAVWFFKGNGNYPAPPSGSLADQFIQEALANGDNFIPGTGQFYAGILFPDPFGVQMNIIEIDP